MSRRRRVVVSVLAVTAIASVVVVSRYRKQHGGRISVRAIAADALLSGASTIVDRVARAGLGAPTVGGPSRGGTSANSWDLAGFRKVG